MPLYTDSNYYYAGGSSQLFAPYYPTGVYSLPSVSSAYAPYTSSYSRPVGGTYILPTPTSRSVPSTYTSHGLSSRYQPKLSTIGESSALITSSRHGGSLLPLTRTHSPKISSYSTVSSTSSHAFHSKYIPPRPININTADIDVSSARYRRQHVIDEQRRERDKIKVATATTTPTPTPTATATSTTTVESQCTNADKIEEKVEQKNEIPTGKERRSTIKRNRPIVRLSTMRSRSKNLVDIENESLEIKEINEQNNEKVKGWRRKLAGDLALLTPSQTKKSPGQILRERFLIGDPNSEAQMDTSRQSKTQEQEDQMLVQVDPDTHICHVSIPSGPSFHDICEDISSDKIDDDLNAGALRKRASIIQEREEQLLNQLQQSASGSFQTIHLERRSSHDSTSDETQSKMSKKHKHKITAIVDVQNAPLTPILQETDEDQFSPLAKTNSPKPNISCKVEAVEEHHKIHKTFKLPKKKSIKNAAQLPDGFLQGVPKFKRPSKSSRTSRNKREPKADVFKFDKASIQERSEKDEKISENNSQLPESSTQKEIPKATAIRLKTSKSEDGPSTTSKPAHAPSLAVVQKSESVDFWPRESIYMGKRKEILSQTLEDPSPEKQSSEVKHVANKKTIVKESSLLKVEVMVEPSNIVDPPKSKNTCEVVKKVDQELDKINQKSKEETAGSLLNNVPDSKKIAISPPTDTASAILPKIQIGQDAKSPEQRQPTSTTVTTTTNSLATKATSATNAETKISSHVQKTINNNVNLVKDIKKIGTHAPTTTTTPSTTTTKPTTTTLKLTSNATASTNITNQTQPVTEAKKKSDAPKKKSSPAKTSATKVNKKPETPTTTTKTTATMKNISPEKQSVAITNKAKTSPINADGFITIAPTKSAVSPPTTFKNRNNASPIINKIAAVNNKAVTDNVNNNNMSAFKLNALAIITPTTKTSDMVAIATSAIPTTTTTAVVATTSTILTNSSDKTDGENNLSKFATVLDLAQCLRDVDAELEDYIPSSAENSDNDLSDDSTFYCSSVDGCENLSASMKKKLKQKKRKDKQLAAQKPAAFDPHKKVKIDTTNKCYVKDEAPRYPLVATPRPLWKREKIVYPEESSEESDSDESSGSSTSNTDESEESEECTTSEEEYDHSGNTSPAMTKLATTTTSGSSVDSKANSAIIRMSTCSNDSGFEGGTAPSSPKKMLGARERRDSPSTPPSLNPAYKIDAEHDESSYTYTQFQKSGRFAPPATVIPRFKNYCVDDFHFLAVLGKGSFGKVLLAELRDTTYYYAVKCLKKDVVLEDDDVDSTLIERKVLALGTKHPYLCHLFCTFQTESHLFFVMEYLNGGDLMFHIQESGRFPEERARFYGAEIISGLKFLHKKGIIYRDLKLDNVLLDFEGHVRIADFGMCKLQIYLDKTADSFCGTPDYMAPEIIKGEKYNQNVDWWSFGVLLYEMLIGQSPFSGCDEDELFWSICNEIPWFPVYISGEATSVLKGLLEKDYTKRIGSQYSPAGEVSDHIFFRPIDWSLLEKKQLEPPFKPQVKHPLDTQYFDRVFTRERVRLTPVDREILQSIDQKQFMGFTYTNPHIALD